MKVVRWIVVVATALWLCQVSAAAAADLEQIKARGELRHLGVRYANFVTGAGDGFDVELVQGFAAHIGVRYTLVYSDFYSVVRDLVGREVAPRGDRVTLTGDYPVRGELRHLGVRYANFVTGAGDGFDVELVQGFAAHIGVRYTLVYSDFYSVVRDLVGREVAPRGDRVTLTGDYPVRGDMIAAGFTVLPWRQQVLLYSEPTFPSQVMLIARADSPVQPIKGSNDLQRDIRETKQSIGGLSLLVMERTCLDPALYGLKGRGIELRSYTRSTNINEMVPALLNLDADLSLLDVPDLIIDMQKWPGKFKVIGPISEEQVLAAAFPSDASTLRDAFNAYLRQAKADGTYDRLVAKYFPGIQRVFPDFFKRHG